LPFGNPLAEIRGCLGKEVLKIRDARSLDNIVYALKCAAVSYSLETIHLKSTNGVFLSHQKTTFTGVVSMLPRYNYTYFLGCQSSLTCQGCKR